MAATLCMTPACALSHHEHVQHTLLLLSQFAAREGLVTGMYWTQQLFRNSKNQDLASALGGPVRPPRMGCNSACNLTLGKSSRGADSCGFDHRVVKHGTGPSAGRNKACWGKEKSQPKATVLESGGCAMLTYSEMVTYLNLNSGSVQIPAKEEETLG